MKLFDYIKSKFPWKKEVVSQESLQPVKNQLEFIDSSKLVFSSLPVMMAKDVPVNNREYVEKRGMKFTFPICPGMFDYSRLGYIVPSWTDFHFKVNKAGSACVVGGGNRPSPFREPLPMDDTVISGIFTLQDGIPLSPMNINSPWKVFSYDKDISALVLPAFYHSPPEFFDNFYVFPGVVDYRSFHVLNVILAPRRKLQYTIKAGDPLLHVIPFYNKDIVCGYGPPSVEQESLINYDPTVHRSHFYRKNHAIKKSYSLEENNE